LGLGTGMAETAEENAGQENEEEEEYVPERRLTESTLWKEDVLTLDHSAPWGSFYDEKAKRWGYVCCRSIDRLKVCTVPKEQPEAGTAWAGKAPSSEEYSADSDEERRAKKRPLDWSNPPEELLDRSKFCKKAGDAVNRSAYIEHFVRWGVGVWAKQIEQGFSGFDDMAKQKFATSLPEAKDSLTPLIKRLKHGESLQKGEEKTGKKGEFGARSRETRTSMEGKFLGEADVKTQFEEMISMAYERKYVKAHKAYMLMTLGNKTWNNTFVQHVAACTMKGAREYRRNRDNLNSYDLDPVSQKYMHAMRKLIHLTQVLRPSDDQSNNVVL